MKYATKKSAKEIIEMEKESENTNYFNGSLSMADMRDMLRNRMGFGEPETNVIMAALVLAGGKFTVE